MIAVYVDELYTVVVQVTGTTTAGTVVAHVLSAAVAHVLSDGVVHMLSAVVLLTRV